MSGHLLFDLETIPDPVIMTSVRTAFEPVVDKSFSLDCKIKDLTIDQLKDVINDFNPSIEYCCELRKEESEAKKPRRGAVDALSSRINLLNDPVPDKYKVLPEVQRIITFGVGDAEDTTEVWQFDPGKCGDYDDWVKFHLVQFWEMHRKSPILTCFNGLGFDIPILMMESKRLGVKCPQFKIHSYTGMEHNVLDVMRARYGRDYKGLRVSALAAGFPTGEDRVDTLVTGANVANAYANGDYDQIATHCHVDIARLRYLCKVYNGVFFNL